MTRALAILLAIALTTGGCKREQRDLRTDPPVAAALNDVAVLPGGFGGGIGGALPPVLSVLGYPFDGNAYQLGEGKRLYGGFNCEGCHAQGGGVTGPALTDGWWRYGPDRVSIFVTLRDGRPHGMPAFGGRLTTDQLWQLTGYIRSMGAFLPPSGAPSRNDEMQARPSENRTPAAMPPRMAPSR
ncbi:c-type cytochrome [Rhodopila sp.]|jgi:cytochrome c oxidase cbb3-type subunit 3|uniref:c-type cytochrome n=1 Tax=Rhodopila sp. TaxID=2480087 RepID=UPI002C7D30ED|nr:c-type cytochrome [Rhodopila sp.]HVZ07501.1 c-type cytochrome [Rhodopila sp.]